MKQSKSSRISRMVTLVVVCVGSAALGFMLRGDKTVAAKIPQVPSQDKPESFARPRGANEKLVVLRSTPEDPLIFGDVFHLKRVRVRSGATFNAMSVAEKTGTKVNDWLQNLEYTIKNRSDKRITYIHFEVLFPDTIATGDPLMVYRELFLGVDPKASGDLSRYGKPLLLNPGEVLTLTISPKHLEAMSGFLALRQYRLSDLTRVDVQVLDCFFEDGTKWTLGGYYKPNPNAPLGWERISR